MNKEYLDNIENLINSPDTEIVLLGYNMILSNEYFVKVKNAYGGDTTDLPKEFNSFAQVCDFVEKVSKDNIFMQQSWSVLADSLYRQVALSVLAKMRLMCKQSSKG